jgi:hypothetical protein
MKALMKGKERLAPAAVAAAILIAASSASTVVLILNGGVARNQTRSVATHLDETASTSLSTRRDDGTARMCGAWVVSRKRLENLKPPHGLWTSNGPTRDILLNSWEMSVSFALSSLEAAVDYSGSDPSIQPAREYLEARRKEFQLLERHTYTSVDEERSNLAYHALNAACGLN